MKAMRERVAALCDHAASRPEGLKLEAYHKKVKRAAVWRGGKSIIAMDAASLQADIAMFQKDGVILPADCCAALWMKEANKFAAEQKWSDYFGSCCPSQSLRPPIAC